MIKLPTSAHLLLISGCFKNWVGQVDVVGFGFIATFYILPLLYSVKSHSVA